MRLAPRLLVGLACAVPTLARAADPAPCDRLGIAGQTPLGVAHVTAQRSYFRSSDAAPCPDDTAACRSGAYVVAGDTVLTGASAGAFVCALFTGRASNSVGYVRLAEVAPQPVPATPIAAWLGTWHNADNTITLHAKGGQLVAAGNAYWPSANPSLKQAPGGPNVGEMSGDAAPHGNRVVFRGAAAEDCQVSLTLVPPFLAAVDNDACGGANVTFTGIYHQR